MTGPRNSDEFDQSDLLNDLKETPKGDLAASVAKQEGAGVNGASVETVYVSRQMKCYAVTESELQQIGLANLGMTIAIAIGSALFAFGLDVFKDTMLAESIPETARIIADYVKIICVGLGGAFWVAGFFLGRWRTKMFNLIKTESKRGD